MSTIDTSTNDGAARSIVFATGLDDGLVDAQGKCARIERDLRGALDRAGALDPGRARQTDRA